MHQSFRTWCSQRLRRDSASDRPLPPLLDAALPILSPSADGQGLGRTIRFPGWGSQCTNLGRRGTEQRVVPEVHWNRLPRPVRVLALRIGCASLGSADRHVPRQVSRGFCGSSSSVPL